VLYVKDSLFRNISSYGRGSVIIADYKLSEVYINNTIFDGNQGMYGGALYSLELSSISVYNTTFINNYASLGGVAYINDNGIINFDQCTFQNN
jgi:hypothetical protein